MEENILAQFKSHIRPREAPVKLHLDNEAWADMYVRVCIELYTLIQMHSSAAISKRYGQDNYFRMYESLR